MASMMRPTHDVLIAGGSFAGLALALALARAEGGGPDIALVERTPLDPDAQVATRDPRAFALSSGTRRLLDAIGVWGAVEHHAQPVSVVDITDSALTDAFRPILLSYETMADGEPQMLILEADRLRQALLRAVRSEPRIAVIAPTEVTGIDETAGGRAVMLGEDEARRARLLVAADGAQSRIRSMAGIGVVGGSFHQRGIAAIVGHEREHEGHAVQHFLPAGPFALLPLNGRRSCITWSEGEARALEIMALDDAAFLEEAQQRAGWRLGALTFDGTRASWPLGSHVARSLVAARLALIGDAVRSVHPIAGQGVNLGFRDVAALAETIVEGMRLGLDPGDATLLTRYERWRRADGVQSAAAFAALNALFANDSTPVRMLRGAGLGVVDRWPGLKSVLVAEAAGATGDVPRLLQGLPL
ncbi:MAG: FAD-dependent monooxygenase [Hyphomicrobiaceae bacterium]